MAGALLIADGMSWLPQAGLVQQTMAGLSEQIRPGDAELADDLVHPTKGYAWGTFSFRNLEAERFRHLYPAIERYYNSLVEAGPAHFSSESYWLSMHLLSFLKVLFRLDPRSVQDASATAEIRGSWRRNLVRFGLGLRFCA